MIHIIKYSFNLKKIYYETDYVLFADLAKLNLINIACTNLLPVAVFPVTLRTA